MLTMIHSNPARVEAGRLVVDRKFHEGMLNYVAHLGDAITTVHPAGRREALVMDPIDVPIDQLGYRVLVVDDPAKPESVATLDALFRSSSLIYGEGFGSETVAQALDIPQIAILEHDLATRTALATSEVHHIARKLSRTLKSWRSHRHSVARWRKMTALHCNGYPVFEATRTVNPDRLLYLDSRMTADMVISEEELERRLSRTAGPLRLLYSGRFEPIKGPLECVKVAIECRRQGLDIELHCYGQGSERDAMVRLANEAGCGDRIIVHAAVPYPELVRISRSFDVFVCCHLQADPSCTYLESFGAGLPIVGYSNTMWRLLCEDSEVGFHAPMRHPALVAVYIGRLAADRGMLAEHSRRARAFAVEHAFEHEFKKRTDDIRRLMTPRRS